MSKKTLLSNEAILQHLLVIHCVSFEDLFEQLPIKGLDRTTIKENAAINSAAESTAVIRNKGSKQLHDKGNNLSSTYNITEAIENGDFRNELEKKVGHKEHKHHEEVEFFGMRSTSSGLQADKGNLISSR